MTIHYEIQHVDVQASERVRALARPGPLSTKWKITITLTADGGTLTAGMLLTDLETRLGDGEES